jgi:hypothetical protein
MYNPESNERLSAPEVARHRFHEVGEAVTELHRTLENTGVPTEDRYDVAKFMPRPAPEPQLSDAHSAEIVGLQERRARQNLEAAYDQAPRIDLHDTGADVQQLYVDSLYEQRGSDDQKAA